MITVAAKVEELVNQSPYMREGIASKLINLSALARELRPQIEAALLKDVTETSVFMALQRYSSSLKPYTAANPGKYLDNLTLRTGLFEVTVKNSATLMAALAPILQNVQHDRSVLFVFTQGIHETTVIASNTLRTTVEEALKSEETTSTLNNLTAISLQRMHDHLEAIGVLMYPLRILAWQGISIIEIVTTLNELMIILKDKDVDEAVISIRQALHAAEQEKVS